MAASTIGAKHPAVHSWFCMAGRTFSFDILGKVSVRVGTFGDEARQNQILTEIKNRL